MANNQFSVIFPKDAEGSPVAVVYGQVGAGSSPNFLPLQINPLTGGLKVEVTASSQSAPFADASGTAQPALIDGSRRQVVVIGAPLPAGDSPIGKVVSTFNPPNFVLMHNDITAANIETVPPAAPKGYSALGSTQLIVDIDIVTPGSYVQLLPVVWNPIFGKYVMGDVSPKIATTSRVMLDIHSPEDIYLMPVDVSGTVKVAVAGV